MIAVRKDDAVSPVVGILLMLVAMIIIAAVVSGFAGSPAQIKPVSSKSLLK